ncbi:ATP-binding protein [Pseudosporangium ferrugineum]|uniref:SARP family transcriptional regulator n=1 Tax=Pseudosporangium ferrugineum TaxID=439699 RepID=A0A2T0RF57_9ACTN|nr:AAA family ATPase [Pseudosporangium ferrugineum]PRY19795.1 SARP family transcriptional regulator [Pseudosporangium ferrugineum]
MEPLRLRLVGPLVLERGGRDRSASAIGSRKARTLLALLGCARGRLLTVDRIVAALWPGDPPARPAENVATLVSRIRAGSGPGVVLGGRAGYRLGDEVSTDLHEAALLLGQAESRLGSSPAAARVAAGQALELLLAGPLLAGEPEAGWVVAARAEQAETVRRARRVLAGAALATGAPAVARDVAADALAADPYDEEACRALMRAYDSLGEPVRALAAYESLRAVLAGDLGVDPAAATRALHVAILRGTPAVAAPPPPAGLAGRDRELTLLAQAWEDTAAGRGAVLLISGEAGIGKTRLADELARRAAVTGRVLATRCYEAERSLFLQPVVEALTRLLPGLPADRVRDAAGDRAPALAALVPEAADLLGAAAAERGSPDVQRRRAYDAVVTFLTRLARDEALLVTVDDLQNAGIATVELLHYLARRVRDARVLVVATVRDGEGDRALATLAPVARGVALEPLDTAAIRRLAEAAGQAGHAEAIERRTRGHTLFVVESLRALAAGDPGVPESLRAGVLARVRRAGVQAEELLRAAAVLGPSFAPGTAAGLLGVAEAEAARRCERLLRTRLTVVAGRAYEFANDLVQEVLYGSLPEPTRIAYHRRAADLLSEHPEAVARHAAAAGDDRRSARAWLAAGTCAAQRYAMADAEALYDRAIEAAARIGDAELLGRGHLARGRVRETSFGFGEALADHTAAVRIGRETGDRRLQMDALYELGGPSWAGIGRPVEEGAAHVRDGLRLAEQLGDRGAEARLLGWLTVLDCNRLDFGDAFRHGRRAREAALASGDEQALLAAWDARKTTHAYLGQVTELSAVLAEMEPRVRRAGDLRLLQWCVFESAFPHLAAGRWDDAEALVRRAITINRRSGYTGYTAWYVAHLGWIARLAGRHRDALAHGRDAARMESHAWFAAAVQAMYATTLLEAGRAAA